jgi:hypothetical protein
VTSFAQSHHTKRLPSRQFFDQGGTTPVMRAYAISCPMCSLL